MKANRFDLNELDPAVDLASIKGGSLASMEELSLNYEEIKRTYNTSNNLRQISLAFHSYNDAYR